MTVAAKAKKMAEAGFWVFPVKEDKTPYGSDDWTDGLKRASNDPFHVEEWFEKYPKAEIGVHCGRSGLVVLDIDYKEGGVDGYDSLDRAWLDVPESFSYTSVSGLGKHILYRAPEDANFNGTGRYRGMAGVDRRAGESYIVYNSDEIPDRETLAMAPEWLCDESAVKSAAQFEGTVKDWYETLETGEPSLIVRSAMDRARKQFEEAGNDWDHAAVVERTYEAVRLGAERHPGVPELLALIEDLFYARTGSHSRPEEEWAHEFQESLASGIAKYGDTIDLYKNLPPFNLATVPAGVPDRLLVGDPGDKDTWRDLMRALLAATDDDLYVTSALWNSVRTRDLSREWGVEFVHKRVVDARAKPEPVRENPTLATPEPFSKSETPVSPNHDTTFLTPEERERAVANHTFIDSYMEASASKGFWNRSYDMPAAWSCLSMGLGLTAVIPKGVALGVNMWFMKLGYSGTGKSASAAFEKHVLDNMFRDGEGYYNLGAVSSPEGILLELLTRDGKPSMIFQDEASTFFSAVKTKDWMRTLEYDFSNYYMGDVPPSNKLSLKELRGKSARTSFHVDMLATPDRLLKLIDTEMFATGFLARFNWMWAEPPTDDDSKYEATRSESHKEKLAPPVTFDLAADLLHAMFQYKSVATVWGTDAAVARLKKAHKQFDQVAKKHEKYEALEPAVTRLGRETIWKCAALLALYENRTTFNEDDALTALYYCEEWFENLVRVVDATSESEFSGDVAEIEAYIKSQGGTVTEATINHRFRNMIRHSPRELQDRLDFLRVSGRINRVEENSRVKYQLNGSAD